MDIVIVSQYLRDIENFKDNNSRFVYLAKLLSNDKRNHIEIITSDFNHATKTHFKTVGSLERVKIITAHESGYPKNVTIKRFISHKELSKNMLKYLKKRKKPDFIYVAVPSLDVAYEMAKYANKNKVKLIIDIQDLWPEAFEMVINIPVLSKLIFYPMRRQADYIYSMADKIISVSNTYMNRALKVNKKDKNGLVVFLGTDLSLLDEKLKKTRLTYKKESNEIWIGYLGTLGSSYDIKTCLEAISKIQKKYQNCKLILLGDGPKKEKFEKIAMQLKANAVFLGRREYIEAMKILSQCDIALNPLVKGAPQSIINKVGDYAALGLPVINSLQNEEYKELLKNYNAGINIECENYKAMANAIVFLIDNENIRIEMGKANRQLAEEKFDRRKAYMEIIKTINIF